MKDQIQKLIDILLDQTARDDERDDAAMDLGNFDDERALIALLQVASDFEEKNEMVLDSCGESIGQILVKRGQYIPEMLNKLTPIAKEALYDYLKDSRAEWLKNLDS